MINAEEEAFDKIFCKRCGVLISKEFNVRLTKHLDICNDCKKELAYEIFENRKIKGR